MEVYFPRKPAPWGISCPPCRELVEAHSYEYWLHTFLLSLCVFFFSDHPPQGCSYRYLCWIWTCWMRKNKFCTFLTQKNNSKVSCIIQCLASCMLQCLQDIELLLSLWSSAWSDLPYWSLAVSDWSQTVFSIHCHWLDMWICLGPPNVPQFV